VKFGTGDIRVVPLNVNEFHENAGSKVRILLNGVKNFPRIISKVVNQFKQYSVLEFDPITLKK
jgi:hypothetical protein